MMNFTNFGEFAAHLEMLANTADAAATRAVTMAAKSVLKEVKSEYGIYQGGQGTIPGWAELATSTKTDRVRKGFPENNPMLRTGEERESVTMSVDGAKAVVGSPLLRALYHEQGNERMPPRSTFGIAAARLSQHTCNLMTDVVVSHLATQPVGMSETGLQQASYPASE